jgi:hypothetical protein
MRRLVKVVAASAAILFSLDFSGCRLPSSGPLPIVISSETLTLEWDSPVEEIPSSPFAASAYRVYFRHHNAAAWTLCGTAAATLNPQVVLQHSEFGNGSFDFAVSTVSGIGQESLLLTSLNPSDSGDEGWYITWIRTD